jgi:hypothetical protein
MKGEFSRLTFDPRRHFTGMLQQQGRVATDADWNEWVESVLYRLKVETIDVIGRCGRPIHDPGFGISIVNNGSAQPSVQLSAGRLYAGGYLAELEQATDFAQQNDWPIPPLAVWNTLFPNGPAWPGLGFSSLAQGNTQSNLFYAEVWLRHVTALNDEAQRDQAFSDSGGNPDWNTRPEVGDFIRERALGGPDHCTRLQTVAQVKNLDTSGIRGIIDCPSACSALSAARPPGTTGNLQVIVTPTPPVQNPCDEPLTGGYGGAENRTYRVEIHDPGPAGTATFKWSNENGAFTVRVNATALTAIPANTDIILQSIGNDQITRLRQNDNVEMCGEETELGMFLNGLAQLVSDPVAQPDGSWKIQLTAAVVVPRAPFLRRWSTPVQTVTLGTPFNLDAGSGLSVSFFDANGGTTGTSFFHDMDYWVWAARTLTRDVEPPDLANTPQAPRGIERHYCCLALVTWTASGAGSTIITGSVQECPDLFPPLTEIPPGKDGCCFCTITVGDGVTSQGQFNDLGTAFQHIPAGGAIVCILPGSYNLAAPLAIPQDNVILRGAGSESQIFGANGVFTATKRSQVVFTGLSMTSVNASVIAVSSSQHVKILENQITVQDTPDVVALFVQGEDIAVERNAIRGTATPGNPSGGGGIQARGNSRFVHIRQNFIGDGSLRGITLGSLIGSTGVGALSTVANPQSEGPLNTVEITGNTIANVGLDGIGAPLFTHSASLPDLLAGLVGINDLLIADNAIQRCWQTPPTGPTSTTPLLPGAISLPDVERAEILRNQIEDNGGKAPISGISIFLAAGLKIDDNRIERNGIPPTAGFGRRGGIIVFLTIPPADPRGQAFPDAWRAASISDNTVEADDSQALVLHGIGPMSVLGNRFLRQGLSNRGRSFGSTVSILNYGIGQDFANFLGTANFSPVQTLSGTQTSPLLQYLETVGGEVTFAQNQCLLLTTDAGVVAPASIVIFSLDDLCFEANQSRCESSTVVSQPFVIINSELFALSNRVANNRFTESLVLGSFLSCIGAGALVTGIGNQGTHCLIFKSTQGSQGEAVGMNLVNPLFQKFCEQLSASI